MKICLPALTTAGLFAAIVILDLINKEYKLIFGHVLLGFISILLILYLCEKTAETAAWILLATPFVLIFLGWTLRALRTEPGKVEPPPSTSVQMPQPDFYGYGNACVSCTEYPCVCKEAEVEKPSTDASGNVVLCGSNTDKPQCINTNTLPSA